VGIMNYMKILEELRDYERIKYLKKRLEEMGDPTAHADAAHNLIEYRHAKGEITEEELDKRRSEINASTDAQWDKVDAIVKELHKLREKLDVRCVETVSEIDEHIEEIAKVTPDTAEALRKIKKKYR